MKEAGHTKPRSYPTLLLLLPPHLALREDADANIERNLGGLKEYLPEGCIPLRVVRLAVCTLLIAIETDQPPQRIGLWPLDLDLPPELMQLQAPVPDLPLDPENELGMQLEKPFSSVGH
jgi:hypothetical protein